MQKKSFIFNGIIFNNICTKKNIRGSIVLEYVMVSAFAVVSGLALLGLTSHIFKNKIENVANMLDIDVDELNFNPFGEIE